jgi:hypothetical protein
MKEFLFDVKMQAAIRVQAETEEEGRKMLGEALDCADGNVGSWPNGDPITCEISMAEDPQLAEASDIEPKPIKTGCVAAKGPALKP